MPKDAGSHRGGHLNLKDNGEATDSREAASQKDTGEASAAPWSWNPKGHLGKPRTLVKLQAKGTPGKVMQSPEAGI